MNIFTNTKGTVRVWSFDGGGKGVLSQLIVVDKLMRHIQWKQRLTEISRPCDHADVMIGTGLGGAAVILMGRLRLTASEAYDDIVQIGQTVFMKPNASSSKPLFSLDNLKSTLGSILERHGYKSNTMMIEDELSTNKCHVVVLASTQTNATGYKSLRTYNSPNSVNCTIVEAIAATMAVPDWFDPVAVGDGLEKQAFIGGSTGYNNPTWEGLLEAKEIFGVDARVTSVISIGSEIAVSAAFPTPIDSNSTTDAANGCVEQMNADCEQTALRLSGYFRDVQVYSRFLVDNRRDTGVSNWAEHGINLVNELAASYLDKMEVKKDLDKAAVNLLLDVGLTTLGKITQAAAVPTGARFIPRLTPYYVPRPEIHKIMNQCFDEDKTDTQKLLVIQGMAGSGKTQSASFFARNHRRRYQHIFFIDASSVASIKTDLQSAIRSLGGSHSQGTFEDALQYLQNAEREHWLIIFDNADDPNLPLIEYIPSCDHGHVIITTRNPDLALLAPRSHLSMPIMEDDEALSVLFLAAQYYRPGAKTERFASDTDHQNAVEICKLVGGLPLALVQVGCYCYSSKVSFLQYLERYKEHRRKLMNMRPGWQLDQYPHSAYTSISLSYSLLDEKEKSLFHLLSFFHPSSINIDVFRTSAAHQFAADPDFRLVPRDDRHDQRVQMLQAIFEEDGKWDQYHVEGLLMRLQTLSLVSLRSDDGTSIIAIHPLVQSFSQDVMEVEEFHQFLYMAVITLSGCVWDANHTLYRHLLLHLSEVESQKVPLHPNDIASFAFIFSIMLLHGESLHRWKAVKHRCQEQLGLEHPSTLFATSYMATSLSRLGEYEASANELSSIALAQEKLLGRNHRDTCYSYSRLALTLRYQGKLQEAEGILRQNIEILEEKHEMDRLTVVASLGENLYDQARYSEAETLLNQAMPLMRQLLGENETVLLEATSLYSRVLMKCDRWEEAEALLQPLVQRLARVFGKNHVRAAYVLSYFALCIRQKGELREAEGVQRAALEVMEKHFGINHRRTVEVRESLEETIRMIDKIHSSSDQKVNGNGLDKVVEHKGKVVVMILAVLVVLIATFIHIT